MRFALFVLIMFSHSAFCLEHAELKAFPQAKSGMKRFVIVLPHKERGEEEAFKVEIIPGKEMLTDGVNLYRLGNTIEARSLQGWGYTYYEVTGSSKIMTTMMAAPEGSVPVNQFVTAPSLLVRYNSRLPVVVYAPQEYAIKYRIWSASGSLQDAVNK